MEKAQGLRGTIAICVGGVAAALLYAWFLAVNFATALGGEARIAQAYAALAALVLLWLGPAGAAVAGPARARHHRSRPAWAILDSARRVRAGAHRSNCDGFCDRCSERPL